MKLALAKPTKIKVVGTFHVPSTQSSRHIPCAVHLESFQKLDCERHGGACLLLLLAAARRSVPATFIGLSCRSLRFTSAVQSVHFGSIGLANRVVL